MTSATMASSATEEKRSSVVPPFGLGGPGGMVKALTSDETPRYCNMGFAELLNCAIRRSTVGAEPNDYGLNRASSVMTDLSVSSECKEVNRVANTWKKKSQRLDDELKHEKYATLQLRSKLQKLEKDLREAHKAKGLLEAESRENVARRREAEKKLSAVQRNYDLDTAAYSRVTIKNDAFFQKLQQSASAKENTMTEGSLKSHNSLPPRPQTAGVRKVRAQDSTLRPLTAANLGRSKSQAALENPPVIPDELAKTLVETYREMTSSVKKHLQTQHVISDLLAAQQANDEELVKTKQELKDAQSKVAMMEKNAETAKRDSKVAKNEVS